MQLTQKENSLLKDMKDQEKLCSEKYRKNAQAAKDPQLSELFNRLATVEDGHLNTLNEISNGSCPSAQGSGSSQNPTFNAFHTADTAEKKNDAFLCNDLLSGEKHASHLYDTCIFEFTDECVRQTLNHIQKEEQEHGKMIYDYMKTNSMYA